MTSTSYESPAVHIHPHLGWGETPAGMYEPAIALAQLLALGLHENSEGELVKDLDTKPTLEELKPTN